MLKIINEIRMSICIHVHIRNDGWIEAGIGRAPISSLAMQLECYILLHGCNEEYLREIIHACQIRMIQQKNIVTTIKNITAPPYTSRLIVESAGLGQFGYVIILTAKFMIS